MRKKASRDKRYFMQNFLVDLFVTNHSLLRQARPYALFYALIDSYRILYNLDSHRNRLRGARRFIGIFFNKSLSSFAFGKMTFFHDKIKPNGENYRDNRDKTIKEHSVYG